MNDKNGRQRLNSITLDPAEADIGPESPLRMRETLPGEEESCAFDESLIESVSKLGILHPPLLFTGTDGRVTVIFGHRRISAAAACGKKEIQANLLVGTPPERPEIISLRAEELKFGKELSGLEKIRAMRKLISFSGKLPEEIIEQLSACYGRELSPAHVSRLTGLLDLDSRSLRALHEGKVTTGDLITLSGHPMIETEKAVSLFSGESLSRGKQKEAVRLMLYLADQAEGKWDNFIEERKTSRKPLLQSLRKACRPALERDMEKIRKIISGMNLPERAAVNPPENLEGDSFTLTVRFSDEPSLAGIIRKLEKGMEENRFGALLDILEGRG